MAPKTESTDLFEEFKNAVKLEVNGLKRFNELESEILNLTPATPEYRAAKHERMELIRQIRGSRKTQKDLKVAIAEA